MIESLFYARTGLSLIGEKATPISFNTQFLEPREPGSRLCVVCGVEYDPSEVKRDQRLCPAHRAVARREKQS